jgi:Tfp pilus assembly protein PilP
VLLTWLQKRAAADDLATWEDQARKQAAAELEQMEQDANLQANIDAEAKKLVRWQWVQHVRIVAIR